MAVGRVAWGWGFGWGLAPISALLLCLAYILLGVGGAEIASANAVLVQVQSATSVLQCGEPALYAVDAFVPLLDLGEEETCSIAPGEVIWRWTKALYGAAGWLIFSLAALTWTGPMRRRTDI